MFNDKFKKSDKNRNKKRFISKEHHTFDLNVITIMLDTVTGVNYIYSHSPVAITPLLDENGKVIVTKIEDI